MAKKAKKADRKKVRALPDYVLPVHHNPEEHARLRAVEKERAIRGGTLYKSLLKDEARRLGIP
jgi:hypothetical protein